MKYTYNDRSYIPPDIHISEDALRSHGRGDTFIETGTYKGDTVDMVVKSGLYKHIHSIELNEELYEQARDRFADNPNVTIHHGDSVDTLGEILDGVDGPTTIWLDAHASGPLPGGKSGGCPIIDELRIIKSHSNNEHTIFIDDCRLFGSSEWGGVSIIEAANLMMEINAEYHVGFFDGHIQNDVMCVTTRL